MNILSGNSFLSGNYQATIRQLSGRYHPVFSMVQSARLWLQHYHLVLCMVQQVGLVQIKGSIKRWWTKTGCHRARFAQYLCYNGPAQINQMEICINQRYSPYDVMFVSSCRISVQKCVSACKSARARGLFSNANSSNRAVDTEFMSQNRDGGG